ncbi:mechanosensitive ion channel protein MscS [Solibaculum mannosilyticum]|uniref:Mechanosensitive ion channel protein MscS n=1 Tax=Solibaculum mannosilyticum TaxID=2780922 RepID=A0A7I8CY60_9FIRM|nr:mechanosensitive ion channel protein MscS [Solibaculum mannosilyticum]
MDLVAIGSMIRYTERIQGITLILSKRKDVSALDNAFNNEWLLYLLQTYGPKILAALVVLILGLWLSKLLGSLTVKVLKKGNIEPSLHAFIRSFVSISTKIVVIVTVGSILGLPMGTMIAALGAAGAAIALAVKDSLANVASGILILFTHPFRVGDYVEVEGSAGTVQEIQLLYTTFLTVDNRKLVIPNSHLTSDKLVNTTCEATRRLDLAFLVGLDSDIDQVKSVLMELMTSHPLALQDPKPSAYVYEYTSSAINITMRVWTKTEDYWDLTYSMLEQVKHRFDEEKIRLSHDQLDVHVMDSKHG